jgi:hypothetical protein
MMKKVCMFLGLAVLLFTGAAYSGPYAPSLVYARLLNSITINDVKGNMFLGTFTATFLEPKATGHVILRKAGGEEIGKWDFTSDPLQTPYSKLNLVKYTDLKTNEVSMGQGLDMTVGDFVLDFYLPSGLFYTFPFTVKKMESPDPFAGGPVYYSAGDWDKWGYFSYDDANPERNLLWCIWLRHTGFEPHKEHMVKVEISRDKDKKVVFQYQQTQNLTRMWQRFELMIGFAPPHAKAGSAIQAKDLLAEDGLCTLVVKIDDKLYGTWKFSIVGGKFQYKGRTDRAKADPKTFIEGGNDIFFYEKS